MEDGDDEFGDLYADVEVEASSSINGAPQFPQLQFVSAETDKQNSVLEASSHKEDKASDGIEFDEDDDDDDLDIVLNSDDDSTRYREGVTIGRTNTKLRSGELEDEDDDNIGMEEFVVGKAGSGGDGINQNLVGGGKGAYNSHSMYKYLRSQSAAYASDLKGSGCGEDNGYCQRMGSRSMGPQSGQRFSLPRARNILDVNVDIFEQKPWKQPGADVTDYFNFGFNEDTWKLYCNQVDEFRHRSSGTPASEPAQLMEIKAYGGGIEHEIVARETKQSKGQPIQVEDSNVERQSSMDVRRQLDRDSDAIQITILDSEEYCSGSAKEGLSHHDGSVPESSNHRDVSVDDGKDHLSFSSASEDESVKERGGEDTCTTDPSMLVVEKSPANHSEESKRPENKRQHGENRYHGDSKCKLHDDSYSRKLADKRKPGDHRYHARCNSPVNNSRVHRGSKPKLHPENDFCSRRPDDKRKPGEHRYRHHSPVYNHRSYEVSKLKPHHENDDSFPMSDIVGPYDVRSTDGRNRRNERLRSIDPYDEGNISYSRELELPSCYYGERFFIYGDQDTLARELHHEGYERFEAKMDLCALRSSEEEEYYGERRRYNEDDKMMAKDWCHHERELAVEHANFFSNQNSNYPSYLKHKRGAQWKRKGDNLQFRTKNEDDECFLDREYLDDIQGERFRSLTCDDRERDDFERNYVKHVEYTRWEFRGSERNKRRAGSPSSELNHPLVTRDEDRDLRYKKGHFFTSRSSEESHINNDRWHDNMTPRNNSYGRHGRYRAQWTGRFRNDGSLVDSEPFDRENYTIDISDRVDMGRTRRHWRSEMQWKEDEVMVRNDDAKFCGERASFRFEKVSRRKSFISELELDRVEESIGHPHVEGCKYKPRVVINDKFDRISNVTFEGSPAQRLQGSGDSLYSHLVDGSNNVEVLINDLNAEGRKYEQKREVISGNKCSKTHGKSREQLALSCRNSVDSHLVVVEGKSADKAERNVDERKKQASIDFNPCPSDKVAVKAVKTKGMAKGLDTEQGQIQTEEVNIMKNDGVNDENGKMGFDKSRILEAMAKMEKRRARFKDQITTNKNDSDSSTTKPTVVDSVQQRPARKRRWGGN